MGLPPPPPGSVASTLKRLLILGSACRSEDYLVKVTQSSKVRNTTEQWALRKYNCKSEFHCFLYKNICSEKQTWPRIFYWFRTLKISSFPFHSCIICEVCLINFLRFSELVFFYISLPMLRAIFRRKITAISNITSIFFSMRGGGGVRTGLKKL